MPKLDESWDKALSAPDSTSLSPCLNVQSLEGDTEEATSFSAAWDGSRGDLKAQSGLHEGQ